LGCWPLTAPWVCNAMERLKRKNVEPQIFSQE